MIILLGVSLHVVLDLTVLITLCLGGKTSLFNFQHFSMLLKMFQTKQWSHILYQKYVHGIIQLWQYIFDILLMIRNGCCPLTFLVLYNLWYLRYCVFFCSKQTSKLCNPSNQNFSFSVKLFIRPLLKLIKEKKCTSVNHTKPTSLGIFKSLNHEWNENILLLLCSHVPLLTYAYLIKIQRRCFQRR